MELRVVLLVIISVWKHTDARVVVGITIHSYSNPNGTAFVENSPQKKCCDGPQRVNCSVGDTCDTYFDICIGKMVMERGCQGAFFQTTALNDTNTLGAVPEMKSVADVWSNDATALVFIRDDDSIGDIKKHDHIDTLTQLLDITPQPIEFLSKTQEIEWVGAINMRMGLRLWCDTDFYSSDCSVFCVGIHPIAMCDHSTGTLTCSDYSDDLLVLFNTTVTDDVLPQVESGLQNFTEQHVCTSSNVTLFQFPTLDVRSNTLSFELYCGDREVTALEFESVLMLLNNTVLKEYFPVPIVRGTRVSARGYGQHVEPNVYFGVEVLDAEHPSATSYVGTNITGNRRCCDKPSTVDCATGDICDIYFSICIGRMVNGACIGAFMESWPHTDTLSLQTCGPTFLDYSTGRAYPQHPMIGAMKLTSNITNIYVTVKDSDLNGTSFDVIDVINSTFRISPGTNVTLATGVDVDLKNVVSLKLRIIAWCEEGYSGIHCLPPSGKITCFPGFTGDDCDVSVTPCNPSPCQNGGNCTLTSDGGFQCACQPGYQGKTCADDKNECLLNVCQNNGTCHNYFGSFNCTCPDGWKGLICTEKAPECSPSPCVHGNCQSGVPQSERCQCKAGWTGSKCDSDVNECIRYPCENSGTCVNSQGSFSCLCFKGFSGNTCKINNNDCTSNSCINNGTCRDGVNSFTCTCKTGYTGRNCEQKLKYCVNVVCANDGVCEEKYEDFQCSCRNGWSGKLCDIDVNECVRHPCLNSGTCTNTPGQYTCTCKTGWIGFNCEAQDGRNNNSYTGSSFSLQFGSSITSSVLDSLISNIYKTVASKLCQGGATDVTIKSIHNRTIIIDSLCNNTAVTLVKLRHALSSSHLQLDLISIQAMVAPPSTPASTPQSEGWVSKYWPVIAGCVGAAVIIAVVVVIGYKRDRCRRQETGESFPNPAYFDDYPLRDTQNWNTDG